MDPNKTAIGIGLGAIVLMVLGGGYYLINTFIIGLSRQHAAEVGVMLSLQASPVSTTVNGQTTVTVMMNTRTESVTAADISVSFPQANLQLTSIRSVGNFLPVILSAGSIGNGTSRIVLGRHPTSQPPWASGIGAVAELTFKALMPGSHVVEVSPASQVAASGKSENVLSSRTPVTISVVGSATPGPAEEAY